MKTTRIGLTFILIMTIGIFACTGLETKPQPSVCDSLEKSLLCELAAEQGMRIEDVGAVVQVANSILIGEGVYSKSQALTVMQHFRDILDNPVSYVFFKTEVEKYVSKYPGLLDVTQYYIDRFVDTKMMYRADRDLLIAWLDKQVEILK